MNFILRLTQRLIKQIPSQIIQLFCVAAYPYKNFMHKYQCIFIHIPKTAGSSVLYLFNDKGARWHLSWLHYFRANQPCFKQYYKFAVVREPIARLFSAYNYCLAGGNQSTLDIALQQLIKKNSVDFNGFIINVLSVDFILQQELFLPQYLYLYDWQLICKVDKILRYETLAVDWQKMAKANGYPETLPKVNVGTKLSDTQKNQIKSALSATAIAKIQDIYQKDFELLNY
jgi:sulfotransferase famil protein